MKLKTILEILKKPKVKAYILTVASIIFIIIAVVLIMSNEFWYNVQNIDYYESQYNHTKSMSRGYFASDYRYLASQWKELYDEALFSIIFHIAGGVALSVGGGIGLYQGLKKLKKANLVIDTDNV